MYARPFSAHPNPSYYGRLIVLYTHYYILPSLVSLHCRHLGFFCLFLGVSASRFAEVNVLYSCRVPFVTNCNCKCNTCKGAAAWNGVEDIDSLTQGSNSGWRREWEELALYARK